MAKACNTRYIKELVFKECNKCQCYYALSEYHKNKNARLGVTSQCKSCIAADHKKYVKGTKKYYDVVRDSRGNMLSRICVKCETKKDATEFNKNSCATTGYSTACKQCCSVLKKSKYSANKQKYSELGKAYYRKNQDRLKQYQVQYKKENREKVIERVRAYGRRVRQTAEWKEKYSDKRRKQAKNWRNNNQDRVKDYNKKYKKDNPDLCKAIANRRTAGKRSSSIRLSPEQNKKFLEIYKEVRALNKFKPRSHNVDHIVPLKHDSICGLHVPWNVQILTQEENSSKTNKWDGTYDNESWRSDL
jgi:hypothetical protein